MSKKVTVNENITVTYENGRVLVSGKTFKATLFLSQSSLMSVYMGSEGTGKARLTIDVPISNT